MSVPTTEALHLRWIAACTLAEFVGIGTAGAVAVALHSAMGEPQTTTARVAVLLAMTGAGAVEGFALGALQWRVLRDRLPRLRAREWIGVTMAVAVLGWLAGMAGPVFSKGEATGPEPSALVVLGLAALLGAGAGLAFGAAQWLVLRHHASRASRWIWIHLPGWAAAMTAIFLGTVVPAADWPPWTVAACGAAGGLLAGGLLGSITGFVARDLHPWVDERYGSLRGKVCAVTGADRGIGFEIARGLARMGATVLLLCRDSRKGLRAVRALEGEGKGADLHVVPCDLGSLSSVRDAALAIRDRWDRLDVLVNNAGATFRTRQLSEDGIESTLAVDVVGPFLLTALLRDRLEKSAGRVVTLAGIYQRKGHLELDDLHFDRRPYHWLEANNQAQRARVLFTAELARRAPRLTAVAVHPGAVLTGAHAELPWALRLLIRTALRPGFVRPELGAAPAIRLVTNPEPGAISGRFFDRFRLAKDAPDPSVAAAFWRACEEMVGNFQAGSQ